MKFVLINPSYSSHVEKHWSGYASLGIAYLAATLLERNNDVSIIDGKLGNFTLDEIVQRTMELKPDIVGISSMTVDFPMTKKISYRLKQHSNIPIILGGPHSNAVGKATLLECLSIDFCCVGEGEQLLIELIACIEGECHFDKVKGLIYRSNNEIIVNAPGPYRIDYDTLPFPAWNLFPPISILPILTHRGCPFKCIFCSHNSGSTVRYRSVINIIAELLYIDKHYQPKQVQFEDETFGFDIIRTKEILQNIIDNKLHHRISFSAQTRVDRIDKEFLDLLKTANFSMLELGVESGSDQVLKRIGKGINIPQVKETVKLAREAGLKVWCKFILGHPNETIDEMKKTVRLISYLNPDQLSVAIMTPYPGTPIYEMAISGKGGYRLLSTEWKSFDKYMGAALELENVNLAHLKWIQIWCYLRLYLTNFRFWDLLRLLFRQHIMVFGLAKSLLKQIFKRVLNNNGGKLNAL